MAEETNTKEQHKEQHKEKSLEKMTIKELREMALELPHSTAVRDMKKEELITFIKEARGIKDEPHVKNRKKVVKLPMSKAELKARIRDLKGQKIQAQEEHDSKKNKSLRHLISQLKKKTRKVALV